MEDDTFGSWGSFGGATKKDKKKKGSKEVFEEPKIEETKPEPEPEKEDPVDDFGGGWGVPASSKDKKKKKGAAAGTSPDPLIKSTYGHVPRAIYIYFKFSTGV